MKKLSPRLLLIIAVVLSLLSAILIYSFLNKADKINKDNQGKIVVVATKDIQPDIDITEDMVKLQAVPKEMAQNGALTTLDAVVGKKAANVINSGDVVTKKKLDAANKAQKVTGFVNSIPNDKRAVTIGIDDISGVSGFVRPGQYVDVVSVKGANSNEPATGKLLLQNVLVLAVGHTDMSSSVPKAESAKTATLALDPYDVVKLRVVQQEGSKLSLVARPAKPEEEIVAGATYSGQAPARQVTPAPAVVQPSGYEGPSIEVIRGAGK